MTDKIVSKPLFIEILDLKKGLFNFCTKTFGALSLTP